MAVRCLYRAGFLMEVAKEISEYELDLAGVQEVRWDEDRTEPAGEYTFLYGKGNENHELGTGFFVHKRIVSAVKGVEFVSDMLSYIIQRGRCCNIIVLNVHAPTEDKIYGTKDIYEELECVFGNFPIYHTKILLGDFNAKLGKEDIFKRPIGNESLHEINENGARVVVNTVRSAMFPHPNIHKFIWTSVDGNTVRLTIF
ncbi:hypothetical protein B7P43_G04440 [Cryptotermes secundus]|uniref:Endonuclease/exonuclease/phosphatase domain-containing protein n=1 Tax=Cryptotermes secundus TaxID=105785 RepID=A0A2J7QC15_9NEOP|nr:hypothetical protein B7P43_G04440 [Cryptotermes secundus]